MRLSNPIDCASVPLSHDWATADLVAEGFIPWRGIIAPEPWKRQWANWEQDALERLRP